jgi:hypothetical protein
MIVFVIPLRNPEIAQDWDRCNALCQQTVRSALAQIDGAVRVIVVGKDFVPDVEDARLTVLRLPFRTPERNWEDQHRDKYIKIAHGLVEARKHAPCYVMKLDADDLVSRHLSSAAHDLGHRPGYYLPYGYLWLEGSRVVRPVENFHHHCGSSNILWCEADELPASIDDDMSKFRIMRWGHNITVREFDKLGTPLMPLPIRSAIYRKGSGENITGHLAPRGTTYSKPNWKYYIGQALRLAELRPFTRTIQRDFFGANSL